MEDALVPRICGYSGIHTVVLILVVMEDALVHRLKFGDGCLRAYVLILVVMEDALVPNNHNLSGR